MGIHAASYLPLPHWLVRDGALRARLLLAMAVLLLALLPSTAYAAEPRSGDSVIVGPNEVIADDLYAFGSTIEIQGTVRGDVIAFGNSVIVSGTVTGDLIAAGATVTVSGRVDGSIRAAGATVIVNGAVGEDVVAAGRSLNIGRTSTIGRDLLMASESALVEGTVGRKLTGGVGNLTLAGAVNGDVQVDVSNLSLTSTAVVGGNLTYTSDNEASIAQGAEVRGSVERRAPERQQRERAENRAAPIIGWFQSLIGLFLTGLLFVLLLPGFSRRTADTLRASPWASLGLGFLLFLLVPPVAFILFVIGLFRGGRGWSRVDPAVPVRCRPAARLRHRGAVHRTVGGGACRPAECADPGVAGDRSGHTVAARRGALPGSDCGGHRHLLRPRCAVPSPLASAAVSGGGSYPGKLTQP